MAISMVEIETIETPVKNHIFVHRKIQYIDIEKPFFRYTIGLLKVGTLGHIFFPSKKKPDFLITRRWREPSLIFIVTEK